MEQARPHAPGVPDAELVAEARSTAGGDMRAFEELVRRHQERVMANCRFLSNSPADAPDLAQEVFVKAYFGLPSFEGRASFGTWVARIKVNHCLNFVRSRSRASFLDIDAPHVQARPELRRAPAAEARVEAGEERERVAAVLHAMGDTLRIPLILRDMDGLSYGEIAERLEIGLSAAKMRIKRGRAEFRRRFEDAYGGGPREEAGVVDATAAEAGEPHEVMP